MNHNLILEVVEQIVLLQEGGNAKAIDIESGEVKQHNGRPANAEQIPLRKIDIPKFTAAFRKLFFRIDDMFSTRFERGLWPDRSAFEKGITTGAWFSGSSSVLFDPKVKGKEISDVKEEAGDIDVQMPFDNIPDLFALLHEIEGKEIIPGVTYIGNNDKTARAASDQIHGIFAYDAGLAHPIFVQIDFEGVEFEDNQPEAYVQFGRSSSFSDMKHGIKGAGHKFLLMNLARVVSHKPNMKVALDGATIKSLAQNLEKQISKSGRNTNPTNMAFSVRKGLRDKFKLFMTTSTGEEIYKAVKSADSTYTTDIAAIFERFFGKQPSEQEFDMFWKYSGVLDLIHDILGVDKLKDAFRLMIDRSLFGSESQLLYNNNRKKDETDKMAMFNLAAAKYPVIEAMRADLDEKKEAYYAQKITTKSDDDVKPKEELPEFEPVAESAQLLRKLIREVIAKR